jgi:formylglycine-generating enzyme required for sulfatase activity
MKRATLLIGAGVLFLGTLFAADPNAPDQRKTSADPPKDKDKEKVITNSIGMKLAYIPAGKFMMGSPADEADRDDIEVAHEVTISKPFYMGVYEVTQREFAMLMSGTVKRPSIFNERRNGGPDFPRENILWAEAVGFCDALSKRPAEKQAGRRYRLPTEAEWEYACRAGSTTPFHFGKSLSSSQANFNGHFPYGGGERGPYRRQTTKVGSYAPNAWGLYDMHGNVAEWCSDYYDRDYYRKSPREDPRGPEKGVLPTDYNDFYRVIRGGCWLDEGRACRSAYRFRAMPHDPYRLVGFRVVCEVGNR